MFKIKEYKDKLIDIKIKKEFHPIGITIMIIGTMILLFFSGYYLGNVQSINYANEFIEENCIEQYYQIGEKEYIINLSHIEFKEFEDNNERR